MVMKYPMVGFMGMAAPMKSNISFFSVIASWILFTCTAMTERTSTVILLNLSLIHI